MNGKDVGAILLLVLGGIGLIAGIYLLFATDLAVYIAYALIAIFVILVIAGIVIYVVGGAYFMVKRKDVQHTDSAASLGDLEEVDREMAPKQ